VRNRKEYSAYNETYRKETMLKYFFRRNRQHLDDQIAVVLEEMERKGPLTDEYQELLTLLERLNELKTSDRQKPVSRDTMLMVAGNLLGIGVIALVEQYHPMMSKGFTQIIKPMKTQ